MLGAGGAAMPNVRARRTRASARSWNLVLSSSGKKVPVRRRSRKKHEIRGCETPAMAWATSIDTRIADTCSVVVHRSASRLRKTSLLRERRNTTSGVNKMQKPFFVSSVGTRRSRLTMRACSYNNRNMPIKCDHAILWIKSDLRIDDHRGFQTMFSPRLKDSLKTVVIDIDACMKAIRGINKVVDSRDFKEDEALFHAVKVIKTKILELHGEDMTIVTVGSLSNTVIDHVISSGSSSPFGAFKSTIMSSYNGSANALHDDNQWNIELIYEDEADYRMRELVDNLIGNVRELCQEIKRNATLTTPGREVLLHLNKWRLVDGIHASTLYNNYIDDFSTYINALIATGTLTQLYNPINNLAPQIPESRSIRKLSSIHDLSFHEWLITASLLHPKQLIEKCIEGPTSDANNSIFSDEKVSNLKNILIRYESERSGSSFFQLFAYLLSFGCLSSRRIYETCATALSKPFALIQNRAFAITARNAALDLMWSTERAMNCVINEKSFSASFYEAYQDPVHDISQYYTRWGGGLINFATSSSRGAETNNCRSTRLTLLLVHGFGAFSMHYRHQLRQIPNMIEKYSTIDKGINVGEFTNGLDTELSCKVYSVTLPGFGRSSKPPSNYSQRLWSQFLLDFIENEIDETENIVVVGNSIGGYTSAVMASKASRKVAGLVLLNSAGPIGVDHKQQGDVIEDKKKPPPQFIIDLTSKILFTYLQNNAKEILGRCYPTNPQAADHGLASEIRKCSNDPGSLYVFQSVFFLPKPEPLNVLCTKFGRPVLILQGSLDPLNDAVGRAKKLNSLIPRSTLVFLESGHCPHDESPEQVNKAIMEFALQNIAITT